MVERLLKFWSYLLIVYRILDIVCDCYCWYHFEESNQGTIMILTCLFGTMFNLLFLYRLFNILRKVQPPDIGKINVSRVLLPGHNFSVLEGVMNLSQSFLGGQNIFSNSVARNCLDSMNFKFVCCCCWGSVMQFVCFAKNLYAGFHGKSEDEQVVNLVGLLLSLISAYIGVGSISTAQKLRSC